MTTDIYLENQALKRQQRILINEARKNEQKLRRIQLQETRFISTNSLLELIEQILVHYRAIAELENVTLALIDPEFELQRILQEEGIDLNEYPDLLFFQTEEQLNQLFGLSLFPRLGQYQKSNHQLLFPKKQEDTGSVALLPFIRHDKLTGSLNLGSDNPERFISNTATDFLERLAAIVAICLENAVNHERLKRVGLTDPLTGVNNRRFFDQRIIEEISRSKRTSSPLTCLLLDIDFFKRINDNYGHQTGDRVLIDVANIIKSQLRDTDVLARYGGEEFSVLLINTSITDALDIAERIRERVAEYKLDFEHYKQLGVTLSIGMSKLTNNDTQNDTQAISHLLIEHADQALYQAKDSGRNQTKLFEITQ